MENKKASGSTNKKTNESTTKISTSGKKINLTNKHILIIAGVVVLILFVGLYIYKWQQVKTEEKYMTSYLLDTGTVSLEIKNLDEVSQILTEAPNEYFILITYTGEKATYELEENIKKIIDDEKLNDVFYYLNVENIRNEDNYITRLNNAFNTEKIKNVPVILYYKDGKIIDTVSRNDNNCINAGDFQKLLDIYESKGQ